MVRFPRRQATRVLGLAALLAIGPATGVYAATPTVTPTPAVARTVSTGGQPTATPRSSATQPAPPPGPHGPKGGDPLTHAQATLGKAQTDLAAAQGKLDVSEPASWLDAARAALANATSARSAGNLNQAREQAGSAIELANAADDFLVAKLGSALPSQVNRPRPPALPPGATTVSPQARVSRDLARTYGDIVNQRDALQTAKLPTPWPTILSQAEGLYKDAYAAYQAGHYDQAASDAHIAGHLVHAIAHAVQTTTEPNQPVSVPAPNF